MFDSCDQFVPMLVHTAQNLLAKLGQLVVFPGGTVAGGQRVRADQTIDLETREHGVNIPLANLQPLELLEPPDFRA